ncbi:hypothetical protein AALO_G00101630 [Alosa alosa]|uniref:Ig-like domain-containing protein n=1 Tax=Alosa alosa TaxID=278164 RepID=A0AAV6GU70_9TELE|nr:sialoadhesin-like [Alosa alosa]KAG5278683.1 hypothetical protein AALO_G00101630 [Alosa alosa]
MQGSVIMHVVYLVSMIFFSGIWSQALYKVTYPSKSVCALKYSSVVLPCSYYPGPYGIHTGHWYREKVLNGDPKDLREEPENRNRVWILYSENVCNLYIYPLKESDSGVYYYGFKARTSSHRQITSWIHGSPGINVTVLKDVQLKVDPTSVTQRWIKLTCATSCRLDTAIYQWYRNEKYLYATQETSIDSTSGSKSEGSYRCVVRAGGHSLTSSDVCVSGPDCWGVTYRSGSVCGLKGSSVVMSCSYKYPGGHQFERGHWHRKVSRSGGEPGDLSLNPLFRDRVEISADRGNCSLAIQDLKESDSGEYLYTFRTASSEWIAAKTGVWLSVTDLQVTVNPDTVRRYWIQVTCNTSCRGSSQLYYYWYRNGQLLEDNHRQDIYLSQNSKHWEGHYSCSIQGYANHRSPDVCILGQACWDVTYASEAICALKGSTVDITCHYKYPAGHIPTSLFWFYDQEPNSEPADLSLTHMYERRVGYWGNNSVHMLRLANLTEADAREYFFRFVTEKGEKFSRRPGVMLSVTSLRVNVTPAMVTEGDTVTLTCSTTCTLTNDFTFTWFKNSRPVPTKYYTNKNHMYLNPVNSSDSGLYTCAVRGEESSPSTAETLNVRYPPRQTSVSVNSSGEIEEGHTVVLSCSCQANPPPHTYTWYRRSGPETVLEKVTEGVNVNFTSSDEGLYHCEAHNEIGSQNSSVAEVRFTGGLQGKRLVGIGAIILAVILVFGILLSMFCRRNRSSDDKSTASKSHTDAAPVYANVGAMAVSTGPANTYNREDHGIDVEYASLKFSASKEKEEYDHTVHIKSTRLSTTRRAEDYSVVYSAVSRCRLSR